MTTSSTTASMTEHRATSRSRPDASTVFLVSGGARGITAQCVLELAQRYQCQFILVGRSSIGQPEPAWAAGCADDAQLKKRAMEASAAQGERPKPAHVQRMVDAVLAQRSIEQTLQAIQQAGGRADYLDADVTDGPQLQARLATVTQRTGPITGLIHAAGALADKLIENKSERDFETVYSVKVDGLENLLRCAPLEQLDYLVLFSSVAAFYGNAGQADYAMANEVLNKFAHHVKRCYPACHVVSINWGPWDGGMVTPELKKLFEQRGVALIPGRLGAQMLADELDNTRRQPDSQAADCPAQVVVGGALLQPDRPLDTHLRAFHINRHLTLEANPFLLDHVIGGNAVLPTVCAIAWMGGVCEQLYPGLTFFGIEDYHVLKGIVFDQAAAGDYSLELHEVAKTENGEMEAEAAIWSKTSDDKPRYHYKARVKLRQHLPPAPTYAAFDLSQDTALANMPLYQGIPMFHGPCFRGVERVLNISPERLTTRCLLPTVETRLQGQFPVQTFNPYSADIQLQGLLIWLWHFHQIVGLPLSVQKSEQFRLMPFDEAFYVSFEIRQYNGVSLLADVISHDAQGQVYMRVSGIEVTTSPRLLDLFRNNRLLSQELATNYTN